MDLFVGGLPWSTTSAELEAVFGRIAEVESATVIRDRDSGRSKGFGYVVIRAEDQGHAAAAALNGFELAGRTISVAEARPRDPRGGARPPDPRRGERDDELLRRFEEAPQQAQSTEDFRNLLDETLGGTPTEELFREDDPLATLGDDIPDALVRVRFVDDGLIEWMAHHPEALYGLTGRRFEELCAEIFARMGFHDVRLTPESGDGGVDIFAIQRGLTGPALYVVQCKRQSPTNRVGRPTLQQLWGVWLETGATKAVLATTSFFTRPAREFQTNKQHRMELRDFDGIREWLRACSQEASNE
jgi:RNA recognition motif-containing protein